MKPDKVTKSDTNKKELDNPKKVAMVSALKQTLGVIAVACERVGISRQTHYRWLEEDEHYKQEVQDLNEMAVDFVETALFKKIQGDGDNKPCTSSIIFYLKTKGKKRGYIERQEITGEDRKSIVWNEQKTYGEEE